MVQVTRNDWDKIMDTQETVLIDIFSETCAPCKMLFKILEDMDGDDKVDLPMVLLSVDELQHIPALQHLSISSVPTLVASVKGKFHILPRAFQQEEILNSIKDLEENTYE